MINQKQTVDGILVCKIPDFSLFWASERGLVYSPAKWAQNGNKKSYLCPERWLKPKRRDGYLYFTIWNEQRRWYSGAHQLAALCFIGPPTEEKPFVLHRCSKLDENGLLNNHFSNLYYGHFEENAADRKREGNSAFGEKNGNVKLLDEQINEIYRRVHAGEKQIDLAKEFNVSQSLISVIKLRETREHLLIH